MSAVPCRVQDGNARVEGSLGHDVVGKVAERGTGNH